MIIPDLITLLLQVALPLALIVWLSVSPLSSRLGIIVQVISTGLAMAALMLAGMWLVLPWWLPWVYVALWLAATIVQSGDRLRAKAWSPKGLRPWSAVAGLASLAIWSGSVCVSALSGRHAPSDTRVLNLAFPLGPGKYLVVQGGASPEINGHFRTLHPKTERQRAYRGQSYAVDLVKIGSWGLRASGWRPRDPAKYYIFGTPVFAPCGGVVIAAADGRPDMSVPTTDGAQLEGNHVVIRCGDKAVLLAHLQQDSLSVAVGEKLSIGRLVGRVGNSGQSGEPHLHIHVQSLPEEGPLLSGEPYYMTFDGDFPVRNDRFSVASETP